MSAPPPFAWTSGEVHADVVLLVGVAALIYAVAWARGPRASIQRPARFAAALLVLLVALNGPLHDLSDYYLFSAHMVQHLLLTLVVPPLLLAGTERWMADALVRRLTRARALGALLRTATRPVPALALYAVALIGWHLPGPYGAALAHHRVHVVEHLALMATALIAWWPVLSPSGLLPRLHYGAQVLYLFAFGIPMTAVAAMITGAEHALYPFYAAAPRLFALTPLADQRLGGLIMWVPAGVIPLVAFTVVFFRWVAVEADEEDFGAAVERPPW
ncbi:MAG: cytochrome c oxidase assembly protein [Candidatus Rokuibacteriota bacterium]|nr:MAG: cytochrome c oxidase assembly protein [Candidatus Rokubacteria bacterium]